MRPFPISLSPRGTRTLAALLLGFGVLAGSAQAGRQLEEPLIDSVRTALQAAISNTAAPEPIFADTAARLAYLRWLTATSDKLAKRMPDVAQRHEFLQTVWYESKRAGLEVSLVLGLIQVESGFRKHVISHAGARGYMQIMPFWTRVIGDGDPGKLFHMQTNLRFGNVILRHYLDIEKGDMFMALGRYNGSRGRATYPNAVMAAQRYWEFNDPGAPIEAPRMLASTPKGLPPATGSVATATSAIVVTPEVAAAANKASPAAQAAAQAFAIAQAAAKAPAQATQAAQAAPADTKAAAKAAPAAPAQTIAAASQATTTKEAATVATQTAAQATAAQTTAAPAAKAANPAPAATEADAKAQSAAAQPVASASGAAEKATTQPNPQTVTGRIQNKPAQEPKSPAT